MSDSIRLSPKHGVNPALLACFWCGKDTGDLALMGYLAGDQEAPRHLVLSYEPCASCAAQWAQGFPMYEVSTSPRQPGQPPICKDARAGELYPTGNLWVITREAAAQLFPEHVVKAGRCSLDRATAEHLGLYRSES